MAPAMTKAQLVSALAEATGGNRKAASAVLDALAGIITRTVSEGGSVTLPGVGRFLCRERPERMARNPATGEMVKVPAKRVARITPLKAFKDSVLSGKPPAKKAAKKSTKKATKATKKAPAKKTTAKTTKAAKKTTKAAATKKAPAAKKTAAATKATKTTKAAATKTTKAATTKKAPAAKANTSKKAAPKKTTPKAVSHLSPQLTRPFIDIHVGSCCP